MPFTPAVEPSHGSMAPEMAAIARPGVAHAAIS